MLRLLLALARPQGGSVRVRGLDLGDLDPDAWRRTVMLAAHTPELLALADRVVTLDGGRVVRDEAARPLAVVDP